MKIGKYKLSKFERIELTLEQLKEILLIYYGYGLEKDNLERALIITKIRNCYNTVGNIVFSVNGSPPKGVGILFLSSYDFNEKEFEGMLYLFGNYKSSKGFLVKIKENKNDTI